ncbi:phosphotransferase [Brucepastera parasyntrophica]|uniref:phosphotransferase family protein n=1 Tax=Brucepastera parasyntrophica TaxID=2880008 RepID=UPI002109D20C|nr:phosphotransferase [Brucepastera parasyntrophica]ULQ58970.1 phosphotransferase [Brucepastera parasyntrophica]
MDSKKLAGKLEKILQGKITGIEFLKSGLAGEAASITVEDNPVRYIYKSYGPGSNMAAHLRHEWEGLSFLHRAGFPVPEPVSGSFGDEYPYILMERIEGQLFIDAYQNSDRENRSRLMESFADIFSAFIN